MQTITFDCEIITPMFISGADGSTPELRAPSIKGMMRYWWRAINSDLSIDDLRKKESEIFGNSDESVGRSKFSIRISHHPDKHFNYKPMPHKDKPFLNAFSVSQKFSLKFLTQSKDNTLEIIKNIFILSSILGGLGKRSRRGFGSYQISKINGVEYNKIINLKNIYEILEDLKPKLFILEKNKIILNKVSKVSFPYIKEIELGNNKSFNNHDQILKHIGESTHNNDKDSLGFASGNERLSSPIYVSILRENNSFIPIITTLNTESKKKLINIQDEQNKFKREILI